ncbi:MAG: alpha/beta hydrolase [Spirosomaceae bacterium]|nr:alpha/beta hydrolase [Spirosomataceae bacterium]
MSFRLTPEETKTAFANKLFQPKIILSEVTERPINYVEVGNDTLPTVIFIHGSPGSWSAFVDFLKADSLLKKVRMVSVDRTGFGYSGFGEAEESLEKQAAYLKPIVAKQKQNGKQVILVGHSLGGPLIGRMAMGYPELIDGLVFVAGSVAPELEPPRWYRYILAAPPVKYLIPKSFRASNFEILHLKAELELMLPLWSTIRQPCIVIQGEADSLVPAANADFLKRKLVNAEYLEIQKIAGMNHFVPWSNPELIVNGVLRLVKN